MLKGAKFTPWVAMFGFYYPLNVSHIWMKQTRIIQGIFRVRNNFLACTLYCNNAIAQSVNWSLGSAHAYLPTRWPCAQISIEMEMKSWRWLPGSPKWVPQMVMGSKGFRLGVDLTRRVSLLFFFNWYNYRFVLCAIHRQKPIALTIKPFDGFLPL